ncbi:thiamine biosynthesis lipoprotein [Dehalogenimonas formicexedens]|uniref:FAD:protein FMN transferase n=1 Tax=Dehalogenimonas formicexedens TaxID=1839801 RepID=A0A1P8FAJ1_9CHLR|nr:FAD:protein FMN transferase [Dehalogenimonas formicexedens]APV45485.1 thiamine biosynthesis lipoprotein [Dehalogenimonas formicexedens]
MLKNKLTRRDFVRISAVGAGVLALGGVGIKELLATGGVKEVSETRELLGTFITIKLVDPEPEIAASAIREGFAEVERLSSIFSRFDPGSGLAMLNRDGYIDNAPPELLGIVQKAKYISGITGGAYDISVLPLLNLYVDSFAEGGSPPSDKQIDVAKDLVGYQGIEIKERRISLAAPGMCLTLDSIAKGFVVDQTASMLRNRGYSRVLVAGSGDMSLRGARDDGQPWKIGLTHPRALAGYYEVFQTTNDSIATSGDYENTFTPDFSWNHIIDPRIGHSPRELASATVIASDTAYADALSTSAMVMGKTDALSLLESLPGVEALLIDKNMNKYSTSGFQSAVQVVPQ